MENIYFQKKVLAAARRYGGESAGGGVPSTPTKVHRLYDIMSTFLTQWNVKINYFIEYCYLFLIS